MSWLRLLCVLVVVVDDRTRFFLLLRGEKQNKHTQKTMPTVADVIMIDGRFYDTRKLAAHHPGGDIFVMMANNEDATVKKETMKYFRALFFPTKSLLCLHHHHDRHTHSRCSTRATGGRSPTRTRRSPRCASPTPTSRRPSPPSATNRTSPRTGSCAKR